MRVIGVSVVRDEMDVIEASIRHAFHTMCDEVLVVDNGSTDDTWRKLSKLATELPLKVSLDNGPFNQSDMVTGLVREATASGADWIVPFDADEFWWSYSGEPREVLASVPPSVGVIASSVMNFVASRRCVVRDPANLLRMRYRIGRDWASREDVLGGSASFIELRYPPKILLRPSTNAVVRPGNHSVHGHDGETAEGHALRCLHAPLRSFADLERRSFLRDRHIAHRKSPGGTGGWQFEHWGSLRDAQQLHREWTWNSRQGARLGRPGAPRLIRDSTLVRLVRRTTAGSRM